MHVLKSPSRMQFLIYMLSPVRESIRRMYKQLNAEAMLMNFAGDSDFELQINFSFNKIHTETYQKTFFHMTTCNAEIMQRHRATNTGWLCFFVPESTISLCTYWLNKVISFIQPYCFAYSSFHNFFEVHIINCFFLDEKTLAKSSKLFFYEQ